MQIGLFASSDVGLAIAAFLAEAGASPAYLVLDASDPDDCNAGISAACGLDDARIFEAGDLSAPATLEALRAFGAELGLLAWWPRRVTPEVLATAAWGFLNLHPSLLPLGRGKDPNFWALRGGDPFGVTIHWVEETLDSGDIAFQQTLPVSWEDTGASLYTRAQDAIVELFRASWTRIEAGDIPKTPQGDGAGPTRRRAELDPASEIHLDASYTARELLNLLRARTFAPHPACWFRDGGRRYEVRIAIDAAEDDAEGKRTPSDG